MRNYPHLHVGCELLPGFAHACPIKRGTRQCLGYKYNPHVLNTTTNTTLDIGDLRLIRKQQTSEYHNFLDCKKCVIQVTNHANNLVCLGQFHISFCAGVLMPTLPISLVQSVVQIMHLCLILQWSIIEGRKLQYTNKIKQIIK